MVLFDSHIHLQMAALDPVRAAVLDAYAQTQTRAAVNGTKPSDWPLVAELADRSRQVIPQFGLHPWEANGDVTDEWLAQLRCWLERFPEAGVGEIGLDKWIRGYDLPRQEAAFVAQWELACELGRPITVHCLRAMGHLGELLKRLPSPPRGFLLHAFGGSSDLLPSLLERGARFSFNLYFMADRNAASRETYRQIPGERLMIETDAPAMPPVAAWRRHPLEDERGQPINHPGNLEGTLQALAQLRQEAPASLAQQTTANATGFFRA